MCSQPRFLASWRRGVRAHDTSRSFTFGLSTQSVSSSQGLPSANVSVLSGNPYATATSSPLTRRHFSSVFLCHATPVVANVADAL
ncbi:uncharacterized protein LMH87_007713 [Akanthomyces muscarius]|uniref:Uncharacterized protein n=1 Tax=Akanthomyces muscarius TaxID=2231603 RepID=A0A9W8QJP0_AKAMU|nr:uncharacterized protein LMH87_007713 [Akanthomyces muscarius]KAJ4161689.1 hypothetical protein LMH87_007713 [Akanthomyces muscarius]